VHLDGFITKKFVTMHGHMNVKLAYSTFRWVSTHRIDFDYNTRSMGNS